MYSVAWVLTITLEIVKVHLLFTLPAIYTLLCYWVVNANQYDKSREDSDSQEYRVALLARVFLYLTTFQLFGVATACVELQGLLDFLLLFSKLRFCDLICHFVINKLSLIRFTALFRSPRLSCISICRWILVGLAIRLVTIEASSIVCLLLSICCLISRFALIIFFITRFWSLLVTSCRIRRLFWFGIRIRVVCLAAILVICLFIWLGILLAWGILLVFVLTLIILTYYICTISISYSFLVGGIISAIYRVCDIRTIVSILAFLNSILRSIISAFLTFWITIASICILSIYFFWRPINFLIGRLICLFIFTVLSLTLPITLVWASRTATFVCWRYRRLFILPCLVGLILLLSLWLFKIWVNRLKFRIRSVGIGWRPFRSTHSKAHGLLAHVDYHEVVVVL